MTMIVVYATHNEEKSVVAERFIEPQGIKVTNT